MRTADQAFPGVQEAPFSLPAMITSTDNQKLKLIRKLAERQHR